MTGKVIKTLCKYLAKSLGIRRFSQNWQRLLSTPDSQVQKVDDLEVKDGGVNIGQGGRDVYQNSPIYNIYTLFGGRKAEQNVNWTLAGQVLAEQNRRIVERRSLLLEDVLLNLGMADVPGQVLRTHPLASRRSLSSGEGDAEVLIPQRTLLEIFDREDIQGRLLILGTPGAGKTTALLGLAEDLLKRAIATPQTTIPVIFELSTWREGMTIRQWLVAQLCDEYGPKPQVYEKWIEDQVLLPLLDGLDELGFERQKLCTREIYGFAEHYPKVVVCCRLREFELADLRSRSLTWAVQLLPLDEGQIRDYLERVGKLGLWEQMQREPEMRRLLEPMVDKENSERDEPGLFQVPLFVSLAAQVYKARKPLQGKADLFERYIEQQLKEETRRGDRDRKEFKNRRWAFKTVERETNWREVRRSLGWVALQLQEQHKVEFLIEKIQPRWLGMKKARREYKLVGGLMRGLIYGPLTGMIIGNLYHGLIYGMVGGLITGLLVGLDDVEPIESFQVSTSYKSQRKFSIYIKQYVSEFLSNVPSLLAGGMLCYALRVFLTGEYFYHEILILGLTDILLLAPILALMSVLVSRFTQELNTRSSPNQGVWNSSQAVFWTTMLYFPFGLIVSLGKPIIYALQKDFFTVIFKIPAHISFHISHFSCHLVEAFLLGLMFAVVGGGGVESVKHLTLRIILTRHYGIPWNLAQFLTYCHERRLLQQIGGRYRFIHRELLDHFAGKAEG